MGRWHFFRRARRVGRGGGGGRRKEGGAVGVEVDSCQARRGDIQGEQF